MDPLELFLVVMAVVGIAGIGLMIRALLRAPVGYQDRDGFHFGTPAGGGARRAPVRTSGPTTNRPAHAAARRRSRRRSGSPAHAA